jgi:cytidylate kinase
LSLAETLLRSEAGKKGETSGSEGAARPPFTITISREAGALGNSVAVEVGRRLGWPVYDRNIIEKIGEEMRRPPSRLADIDERPTGWLEEMLASLSSKPCISTDVYLKYLLVAVRGLGAQGRCVIVGRGANFILPAETTLRVRLVARPEDRLRVMAARLGLPEKEAAARMNKTELERSNFIAHAFGRQAADAHHYDLVLNMSRFTVPEAADIIVDTLRRFESRLPTGKQAHEPRQQLVSCP